MRKVLNQDGPQSLVGPLDQVLHSLKGRGLRRCGTGWEARCPAHDDRKPSLTVNTTDKGDVLLCCQKGCETQAVVAALDLEMKDLFRNSGRRKRQIVARYDYRDERGALLFQVVRYDPKGFSQRRPDGNGAWIANLNGVRRVLYRLPELLAADPSEPVFLCEGEKDADTLIGHGLVATTNPGGAGKWRPEYNPFLRSRHVIILPDHDATGSEDAEQKARSLYGVAASVKVLHLSGLPSGGDVTDWLGVLGTARMLKTLAKKAPPWSPAPAMSHGVAMSHSGADERNYVGEGKLSNHKTISVGTFCSDVEQRVESAIHQSTPVTCEPPYKQVFGFVRKLKAIPQLAEAPLSELKPFVRRWHRAANAGSGFDAYWDAFLSAWRQARSAEGDNIFGFLYSRAFKAFEAGDRPLCALQYEDPGRQLLVCLCRELQWWWGPGKAFPLAGSVVGCHFGVDRRTAARWLEALVADGILDPVTKGTYRSGKASAYRYLPDGAHVGLNSVRKRKSPSSKGKFEKSEICHLSAEGLRVARKRKVRTQI